ncbi:MAG: hypothetical protein Q8P93_03315 [bacterium]|nr:hypothetical protein [bacterium]
MSQEKIKHSRLLILTALMAAVTVLWWSYTPNYAIPETVAVDEGVVEEVVEATPVVEKSAPTKTATGAYIVRYTNDGFTPFMIEIRRGQTIQFQNESSRALWVTTKDHPTAKQQALDELDFGRSLQLGQVYEYTANKVGVWGYYNLNDRSHLGTIVVID